MSLAAITVAIRTRFSTEVETPRSLTTVYDNLPLSTVPDVPLWCRVSILFGETTRLTTGGPGAVSYRQHGTMIAEVYGPIGKGDAAIFAELDAVIAAFRGVSTSSPAIKYDAPYASAGTVDPDGPWWKRNVVVPFWADEIG